MPVQSSDEKKDSSSPAFADYGAEPNNTSRQILAKAKPPDLEEVLEFFWTKEYPENEANKFFNYFKSIGWLVGGKTPMADWQAAANNWMLNAPKFISHDRTDRTQQLDTSAGKDYSEPL